MSLSALVFFLFLIVRYLVVGEGQEVYIIHAYGFGQARADGVDIAEAVAADGGKKQHRGGVAEHGAGIPDLIGAFFEGRMHSPAVFGVEHSSIRVDKAEVFHYLNKFEFNAGFFADFLGYGAEDEVSAGEFLQDGAEAIVIGLNVIGGLGGEAHFSHEVGNAFDIDEIIFRGGFLKFFPFFPEGFAGVVVVPLQMYFDQAFNHADGAGLEFLGEGAAASAQKQDSLKLVYSFPYQGVIGLL